MPNIDNLIDSTLQIVLNYQLSLIKIVFSTMNLKYVYNQIKLHPSAAKHCNFNIVSGDMTGMHQFKTVFFEVTDIPAELQKAMENTPIGLKKFLSSLIIYSEERRAAEEDHFKLVIDCLNKLDAYNCCMNLTNCQFAKNNFFLIS